MLFLLRITRGVFGLLLIGTVQVVAIASVALAADVAIVLQTDKPHYDPGDTILLFGQVNGLLPEMPLIFRVFSPGQHLVTMDQFSAVEDGSFSRGFVGGGPLWGREGTFRVTVNAGTNAIAKALIGYPNPNSAPGSCACCRTGTSPVGLLCPVQSHQGNKRGRLATLVNTRAWPQFDEGGKTEVGSQRSEVGRHKSEVGQRMVVVLWQGTSLPQVGT